MLGISTGRSSSASALSLTINPFDIGYGTTSITYSESNMRAAIAAGTHCALAVAPKSTGKWNCEIEVVAISSGTVRFGMRGINPTPATTTTFITDTVDYAYISSGAYFQAGSSISTEASYTVGDFIQMLFDNGTIIFAKNGTLQSAHTSGLTGIYRPCVGANGSVDIRISTTLSYPVSGYSHWR